MKKLNKLEINTEKVMKNEELVSLRGGYGGACCICANNTYPYAIGAMAASNSTECRLNCISAGYDTSRWDC
jgi:natural product precursor